MTGSPSLHKAHVFKLAELRFITWLFNFFSVFVPQGSYLVPAVVTLGVTNAASGQTHNSENNHDDQPDEGAGNERERIQKSFSKCSRHG